jgi:hypothetical protein
MERCGAGALAREKLEVKINSKSKPKAAGKGARATLLV